MEFTIIDVKKRETHTCNGCHEGIAIATLNVKQFVLSFCQECVGKIADEAEATLEYLAFE